MMTNALSTLVTLAWALWFGGTMTLFLAVTALFKTFAPDRTLAGTAAAGVFRAFERFQWPLAIATVVLSLLWRVTAGRSRSGGAGPKPAVVALLALSMVAALAGSLYVSPQIELLRVEGRTGEPAFGKLHGASMMLYMGQAGALLLVGLLLPAAIRRDAAAPSGLSFMVRRVPSSGPLSPVRGGEG